jgi:hypothetical protein
MKISTDDQEIMVQLATRVPRRIARDVKQYCVRNDLRLQSFVRTALTEKLARGRAGARRRA